MMEDDGSAYEAWKDERRADLERDFAEEMSDEFDDFCFKKFEREQRFAEEGDGDGNDD